MKSICKFTVDSDDEVVHIYSVNKDGVVVISDDDDTPVQSSGITNAGKFNNSLQSTPDAKTNAPSSTVNEKSRSPPARHRQVSIEPKKDQHVSQSQNMMVTIKVSELAKAEDKGMCLNREENIETQHSSHLKIIKPTSSRHSNHSFDSNEKKTERSHSPDLKKKDLSVDESCSSNRDAHHAEHGRCRTFSAPCGTGEKGGHETYSEDKCERDDKKSAKNNNSCSDLRRVNGRRRTNSAPCGSNSARDSETASCPRSHSPDLKKKDLSVGESCSSNKDAHHAAHGRCRTFSARCSTGEKGRHETYSEDKCERDGTSAKNNNSRSNSCRVNDRRRTNSAPCSSNSAKDSETASCSTRVNGKRKIPKSLMDVKLSKRKRARPGCGYASSSSQTSPSINLPSLEKLSSFSHIIFIDLDNWNHITTAMYSIPKNIFVWGFCGGDYNDKRRASFNFRTLLNERRFFRHPKCSKVKNAADFALCVQVARLDLQLPNHIAFTILSGDKSFSELKNQLKCSSRQIHIINPHNEDPHILHGLLASIADT